MDTKNSALWNAQIHYCNKIGVLDECWWTMQVDIYHRHVCIIVYNSVLHKKMAYCTTGWSFYKIITNTTGKQQRIAERETIKTVQVFIRERGRWWTSTPPPGEDGKEAVSAFSWALCSLRGVKQSSKHLLIPIAEHGGGEDMEVEEGKCKNGLNEHLNSFTYKSAWRIFMLRGE